MKIKIRATAGCLLLITLLSFQARSQSTYYLATPSQGGNDANSGKTISAPLATLTAALAKIVAGDTIYVRSGTYASASTIRLNKAGTASSHIVLSAYKPDLINADARPVFDFSAMIYSSSNRGLLLSGANYWDIYGITIKGAGDNGMNVGNSGYTTITFCSFTRNRDTGLQLGGGSHHITITNCDSYENADLGPGSTSNGGNADGFAPKLDIGDSIWFRGCRAWLNSDDGWDGYLRPSNNVNAILEDCWSFRNGYYWLDGSTTSSQNGNGFKLGGSDTKDLSYNFTVINCLTFDNKANGFDQNSNAGAIRLYNCSAYRNLGRDYFMTSGTVTYQPGAALLIKNCLSLGARGVSLPVTTAARPYTESNNSFSTATSSAEILSLDTTGVTAPRNADGSLARINFMRLNPAAPKPYAYIDAGTVLSDVVYRGMMGVPYAGAAPDLGAFESSLDILPASLTSFSAVTVGRDIALRWKTGAEQKIKGWSVERAVAGSLQWQTLGFVMTGNISAGSDYRYMDKNPGAARLLYRLRQTDMDNTFVFSKTVHAEIIAEQLSVSIYPNPVGTQATLSYSILRRSAVGIAIYNAQGHLVYVTANKILEPGRFEAPLNTSNFPPGKYVVRLKAGDQITTTSFIRN